MKGRTPQRAFGPPVVALALLTACQPDRPEVGTTDREEEVPAESAGAVQALGEGPAAQSQVALTGLFALMAGLERDMAGISRGLWRGDLQGIAAGAEAVANHPTVPPQEAQTIGGILGAEMAEFKAADTRVHHLAIRVRDRARAGDFAGALSADGELRHGCVECHTRFRQRIREGLR